MKTIKELAEEIGVSKVAVIKKVERLNIKNKLVHDGNRLLVPEELEKTIKIAFNKYDTDNPKKTDDKQTDNITETLITMLKTELEEKNKQIERLQSIITQEQTLRMISEQKVIALEQKEKEENENQEVKQGFWGRLFGTKPKQNDNTSVNSDTDTTDTTHPNEDEVIINQES